MDKDRLMGVIQVVEVDAILQAQGVSRIE